MNQYINRIKYTEVEEPKIIAGNEPVDLSDDTMKERLGKVLKNMTQFGYDALVIYADREHGGNFGYLTGFEPRFEESVLILHQDGRAYIMLGNETLRMTEYARLEVKGIHVPYFSLPNQPMGNTKTMKELFETAEIKEGQKVGVVGWKMFTSQLEDSRYLFDIPEFIVKPVREIVGDDSNIISAADLFIHPDYGVRARNNANEIAHYEFGAGLASKGMLTMLNQIEIGSLETELAANMAQLGQIHNVTTIVAAGDRFTNAVVFPRAKKLKLGDKFSSTVGYRGGLSSRSGYVVSNESELPVEVSDYLERVAKPYYSAAVAWYESIQIGMKSHEMYELIGDVLPKNKYGWHLNPGHLTSDEEWMSSPIYPGSKIEIKSGMLFQMDIIPSVPGYGGAGAEDGIALADAELREQLKGSYPKVWERIQKRRDYMRETLGIQLKEEVLPLSDIAGYMRPLLLNRNFAFSAK